MLRNDNVPENGTAPYIRVRHQGRVRESLEMAAEMRQEQQRQLCAAGIALLLPSLGHLASLQPEDGQLLFSSLLSSTFLTHSACLGDALPAAASPRWKKKKTSKTVICQLLGSEGPGSWGMTFLPFVLK